jgi:hypothetical protein
LGYLRSLFCQFCDDDNDIGARSMLACSLQIGSYFIAASRPQDRSPVLQLAPAACSANPGLTRPATPGSPHRPGARKAAPSGVMPD